jgi:hypothetical protein
MPSPFSLWTYASPILAVLTLTAAVVPGVAEAQVTSLVIVSDYGDYVGAGQSYTHVPADGSFTATHDAGSIQVGFHDFDEPGKWWSLTLAAPMGQPLTPGEYDGAVPFLSAMAPRLRIGGYGRGCGSSATIGSFIVTEFEPGEGSAVRSFRATFEQRCDGLPAALRGEIRFNVAEPILVSAPLVVLTTAGQLVSFQVTASDLEGEPVVLDVNGLPPGATFTDLGDGTAHFNWQTSAATPGQQLVTFVARNSAGETEATWTQIRLSPSNDALSGAQVLPGPAVPSVITGATINATAEPDEPVHGWSPSRSVWFKWTAASAERLVLETEGATFRPVIAVYTDGTALTPPSMLDLQWAAWGVADPDSTEAKVSLSVQAGVTYFIAVDAYEPYAGTFGLRFRRSELTKALWRHTSGAISLWSVDSSGHLASNPQFGPFPGWEALRLAVAPDGTSRVLWRHAAGHVSLWRLDRASNLVGSLVFGPYAGWTVEDVAVDAQGGVHLSWRHSSGALGLWFMAPSGSIESALVFGPYPNWQAVALAAGPVRHTLWRHSSNATGLWTEYYSYGTPQVDVDGPGPAWTPVDVAPYLYHLAWVLSTSSSGAAKLWWAPNTIGFFGPFPGWQAVAVAGSNVVTADHGARVLWRTNDGRASIWHTDPGGQLLKAYGYGPYPGWTIIDIAAGPD